MHYNYKMKVYDINGKALTATKAIKEIQQILINLAIKDNTNIEVERIG